MSGAIRVLLADDHAATLRGLREVMEEAPGFVVVGEAPDATQAIDLALATAPDVCVLDLHMPGGGGLAAARAIKPELPGCVLVMLTVSEDPGDLLAAIRAGFDGYLPKTMSVDRLPEALRGALAGETAIPRRLMTEVVDAYRTGPGPGQHDPDDRHTERENEVLDLLLEGLTTKEAALRLGVSAVTVRRHVSAIVQKAGAEDRDGALATVRAERVRVRR